VYPNAEENSGKTQNYESEKVTVLDMCIFFPSLTRRSQYSTTSQGSYHREYKKYRKEIQRDCLNRCVYCDGIEDEIGGEDVMQLDHFRPQQKFPRSHFITF
jgi:hypothetical protein